MCQAHSDTELEYWIYLQFLAPILIASDLKSVRNLQGTINLSECCILDSLWKNIYLNMSDFWYL